MRFTQSMQTFRSTVMGLWKTPLKRAVMFLYNHRRISGKRTSQLFETFDLKSH